MREDEDLAEEEEYGFAEPGEAAGDGNGAGDVAAEGDGPAETRRDKAAKYRRERRPPPKISILVRAHNDEAVVARTLEGIFSQEGAPAFEVLFCDDRSTDRTKEIASRFPVRFVGPFPAPYVPGRTLNALVRMAAGKIVVFNNSDAVPLDRGWLRELVAPLLASPGIPRATFANQLPRAGALAVVRRQHERAFGDGTLQAKWRFFFSLASSATWRSLVLKSPFDERIRYSEDVEWAWRNVHRTVNPLQLSYCPRARVEHSHDYPLRELAKRFRGEGAADAAIFADSPSLARELAGAAAAAARDWAYLLRHPRAWGEIPLAPVRRLVQHVSHWRGTREVFP